MNLKVININSLNDKWQQKVRLCEFFKSCDPYGINRPVMESETERETQEKIETYLSYSLALQEATKDLFIRKRNKSFDELQVECLVGSVYAFTISLPETQWLDCAREVLNTQNLSSASIDELNRQFQTKVKPMKNEMFSRLCNVLDINLSDEDLNLLLGKWETLLNRPIDVLLGRVVPIGVQPLDLTMVYPKPEQIGL